LCAKPDKSAHWQLKLSDLKGLKVGLVWSGGFRPNQPEVWGVNERRNIPVVPFSKALQNLSCTFVSLQKGDPAESEVRAMGHELWPGGNFLNFSADLLDFTDTAGLIEHLDLVIGVDTSTAHLAAAMGKPVWLLNRFDTCWRWLLDREDSPWYPTLKLYRQPAMGDWDSVLQQVRQDLELLV
jgi:hypothetical protein